MRRLIPALLGLFVILTDPQGRTIYVAKSAVVAVLPPQAIECTKDTHAKVYTVTALVLCVAEDVADVKNKVEEQ